MSTPTKTMRAYLSEIQMWQRKAVTKKLADIKLDLSFTDRDIIMHVSIWQRDKDGKLKRDAQCDFIGSTFDLYQYRGESENRQEMDAMVRLLNDFNAL